MNRVLPVFRRVAALLVMFQGASYAEATQLSAPLVLGGNVATEFEFEPDGQHVVYVADQDVYGTHEIFRVPAAGGEAVRVSGSLVAGGDVVAGSGRFNVSGSHRFFVADAEVLSH